MDKNFWMKIWTFPRLSKSLIKKLLEEKMNDFYRIIKLKAHFRDSTKVKEQTGEEIFKMQLIKRRFQMKIITLSKLS